MACSLADDCTDDFFGRSDWHGDRSISQARAFAFTVHRVPALYRWRPANLAIHRLVFANEQPHPASLIGGAFVLIAGFLKEFEVFRHRVRLNRFSHASDRD